MKKTLSLILPLLLTSTLISSCGTKVRYEDKGETYHDKATDIVYDTKSGKPLTGIYVVGVKELKRDGDQATVEFKDGKAHGKGIYKLPNGYYWTRQFFNGKKVGLDKYYDPQGNEISKDEFSQAKEDCRKSNH